MANYRLVETEAGNVRVVGGKHAVTISKREKALAKIFAHGKIKPSKCPRCKSNSFFKIGSTQVRAELAIVTAKCAECGYIEHEPID